ncbi:PfkB family carbohydrate kinase [Phycisphaera mikurensis]|uniref:Putative phosphotransferase n=1 Tax=Phycisphaera mikurensis (strain NBRC 102666 / KCTC 22515 / FYK2301M01) TaxID=1142394 RepID=I0IAS5_PHYMF|nr:PfkB family carbohydrate kinase [Phycisphaera mikurensis]MBB6442661.1 sugar/nucleoside kinase (ribokinase family) [Phycisphaera mikurensis]BAM02363.1 putative phosphotransferase [Phycisphaera mikurensis NBRC 102666]
MNSLLVTGSIGIDTVHTPTGSADSVLGGSAIYFAAAASFQGPVRLVAAVGDDFPAELEAPFHRFDIDLAGLEKRAGSKTFRWTGRYLENMNDRETLSVDLNVLGEDGPPVPEAYADTRTVFLANAHPAAQLGLRRSFPDAELVVADTMDLWISIARDELMELLKNVDGLVLNDAEAFQLTEERNVVRAGRKILEMGPAFVVVKKGEHGAVLVHRDGEGALPAFPAADVVDPTGAGDSFGGGMMGRLAATGDRGFGGIMTAMAAGTVVASFTIEAFSLAALESLTREELAERERAYVSMLDVG